MIHLASIAKKAGAAQQPFPFNVPSIRSFSRLRLEQPVTFLVGENGSGKSTFLEAVAAGIGAVVVGGHDIDQDDSLRHARALGAQLRFGWNKKTGRGFFLCAEDFFNFSRRINNTGRELQDIISGYEEELKERPDDAGLRRAIGYMRGQKAALTSRYGQDMDANSHGEGFMKLFQARLAPNGLYLLDEPEAALSPLRQLSFLSLLKQMTGQGCQFLIATHSPILMAFPDASIQSFDTQPISEVAYDELEHVRITKAFLGDPQAFLRRL